MPVIAVPGARNLGRAVLHHFVAALAAQFPRGYTHEAVITPAGDRRLP
jgi:hypothetical protein